MKTPLILFAALFALTAHAETPAKYKIRMAFPSVGTLMSGQVGTVLQKTDLFKRHGFDAEITPMPLGKELKSALVGGQVDVIFTSESNFVVLVAQGYDCLAISTLGTGGDMGLVVKADSPYKKVSDLKGKKIGTIFGTSLHEPAIDWPKAAGLNPDKDITLLNMRGMGPMNSALETGAVEAITSFDPYLLDGVKQGRYRVLARAPLDLIIVISGEYARKNPGVIEAFNEAVKDATYYVATHKKEANQWSSELNGTPVELLDEGSRTNPNYLAKSLSDVDIRISPRFRKKLDKLNDFFWREKLVEKRVSLEEFIR